MLVLPAIVVALVLPAAARATPSARLIYARAADAESCPDESALRSAVAARLGYDPFFPYAKTTLFAEIERDGATYRARVKLVDEGNVVRGARDLKHESARCADLVDAIALTMSIAIDPRSVTGPVTDPSEIAEPARIAEAPPANPPLALSSDSPPPAVARAAAPAERVQGSLVAFGTTSIGSAPSAAVGVLPGAELRWRWLAISAGARIDARASREVAQGTVATSYVAAAVAPCVKGGVFLGCASVAVGSLTASAEGISRPRDDAALHVLVGPRVGLVWPIASRLDVRVHTELMLAMTRQVLRVDGQDAHALPLISGGAAVGLGVRLF